MKKIRLADKAKVVKHISESSDKLKKTLELQKAKVSEKVSEKHLSKSIEHKISRTHKIWENTGVSLFSVPALVNLSHYSSYGWAFFSVFIISLIRIFPTSVNQLEPVSLLINFFITFAAVVLANLVLFVIMKSFGSKTKLKVFFFVVNTAIAISMVVVSITIALVAFAVFSTMAKHAAAVSMFFSMIPFYNYLIWGWSAETVAQLKGVKSVIFALIALLFVLGLNLVLPSVLL